MNHQLLLTIKTQQASKQASFITSLNKHPIPTVSLRTRMWTHTLAPCGGSFGGSHMLHSAMQ